MNILKNLTVGFLTFILFLSIIIFGVLLTVKSTVLNPQFITNTIDDIDVVEFMDEFVDVEGSPETLETFEKVKEIVPDIEPVVKARLGIAVNSVYDYLLGRKSEPELKATMGDSFLNPDFVDSLVEELDLAQLVEELAPEESGEEGFPPEFIDAISTVVADLEPEIKQKLTEVSEPVFDYLLGNTDDIDLASTLRDTVLNTDFVVQLIEEMDLSIIAGELLGKQLIDQIPEDMEFLTEYLAEAIAAVEPTVKEELSEAADPLLDYLLGESPSLRIEISLAPIMDSLEDSLREHLSESPPPEYAELSPGEREKLLDDFFKGPLAEMIPSTYVLDESILSPDIAENIADSLADFEDTLYEIRQEIDRTTTDMEEPLEITRQYISHFQLAYTILIVIMSVSVLGIILILRDVKSITRRLGIPLLVYGAIEYAGVLVARYFLNGRIPIPDIPPGVETWMTGVITDIVRPLEIFSLSLLVIGVVLTVVSFVYKRGERETIRESVN